MSSPVAVLTTPTLLIGKNSKRKTVQFQNDGDVPVFIKKWDYKNPVMPIPSPVNFDFMLNAKPGEGQKENEILQIESVSGFVAIAVSKPSLVAVMETVKVVL